MQKAQGTIEYIVIIAIVIVIGLVVVGTLYGFVDFGTGFSKTSGKIQSSSSPISIIEIDADPDGDGLISLQNNTGETLTITKIKLGNVDNNFNQNFTHGNSELFSLNDLGEGCSCVGQAGKTINCQVTIYYTSENYLNKSITTLTIPVDCDNNVTTSKTPVTPITETTPPNVTLTSPTNPTTTLQTNQTLNYTVTDDSTISRCDLIIDNSIVDTNNTGPYTSFTHNFESDATYYWDVNCTDEFENEGSSNNGAFTITIDYEPYLLLHLPFDSTQSDNDSIAHDISGNGINGTVNGTAIFSPTGGHDGGGAYNMGNAAGSINLGNNAILQNLDKVTISVWVKPSFVWGGDTGNRILCNSPWGYSIGKMCLYFWQSYKMQFSLPWASGNYVFPEGYENITLNQWYHIVGVYDGDTIITYVDGNPSPPAAQTGNVMTESLALEIGKIGSDGYYGYIDDVRIYRGAITDLSLLD